MSFCPFTEECGCGLTGQVHSGDRNHSAALVLQDVAALVAGVHVLDLDVGGVGQDPVPVVRDVLGDPGAISHLWGTQTGGQPPEVYFNASLRF